MEISLPSGQSEQQDARAAEQLQRERKCRLWPRALEQIRHEAADLSVAIASKLIQKNITREDNERLIDDALKQLQ